MFLGVNKVGISTLFGKQGVPFSVMLFCGFAISWHHVDSSNVQSVLLGGKIPSPLSAENRPKGGDILPQYWSANVNLY